MLHEITGYESSVAWYPPMRLESSADLCSNHVTSIVVAWLYSIMLILCVPYHSCVFVLSVVADVSC